MWAVGNDFGVTEAAGDAGPLVGLFGLVPSASQRSVAWRIATTLGNVADPLVLHRWAWFAATKEGDNWHAVLLEDMWRDIQPMLANIDALINSSDITVFDKQTFDVYDMAGAALDVLLPLGRRDGFALLRKRAAWHYERGEDLCRQQCAPGPSARSPRLMWASPQLMQA